MGINEQVYYGALVARFESLVRALTIECERNDGGGERGKMLGVQLVGMRAEITEALLQRNKQKDSQK